MLTATLEAVFAAPPAETPTLVNTGAILANIRVFWTLALAFVAFFAFSSMKKGKVSEACLIVFSAFIVSILVYTPQVMETLANKVPGFLA